MQVIKLSSPRLHRHPLSASINKKIAFTTCEGIQLMHWSEITHCKAESNYCRVQCRDGKSYLFSRTLKAVEGTLPNIAFLRVHQSNLVAIREIRAIGHDEVILNNGISVPLARGRRAELLARIESMVVFV